MTQTELINVQATKWSALADVDEVKQISDDDAACLRDVRDVLARYGALDRFGISLLHSHFRISPDEMLMETTDEAKRVQTIRPISITDGYNVPGQTMMVTQLKLCAGDAVATVGCGCLRDKDGHTGRSHR